MADLVRYDRLLEIGVGDRPGVARALAARGRDVTALDVDVDADATVDRIAGSDTDGSLRLQRGDVVALADAADPAARIGGSVAVEGVDAVYGLRLPAELQRPTVDLATRLDAACRFTTLGFEDPVVPVERRSIEGTTLYVARRPSGDRVGGPDPGGR